MPDDRQDPKHPIMWLMQDGRQDPDEHPITLPITRALVVKNRGVGHSAVCTHPPILNANGPPTRARTLNSLNAGRALTPSSPLRASSGSAVVSNLANVCTGAVGAGEGRMGIGVAGALSEGGGIGVGWGGVGGRWHRGGMGWGQMEGGRQFI